MSEVALVNAVDTSGRPQEWTAVLRWTGNTMGALSLAERNVAYYALDADPDLQAALICAFHLGGSVGARDYLRAVVLRKPAP